MYDLVYRHPTVSVIVLFAYYAALIFATLIGNITFDFNLHTIIVWVKFLIGLPAYYRNIFIFGSLAPREKLAVSLALGFLAVTGLRCITEILGVSLLTPTYVLNFILYYTLPFVFLFGERYWYEQFLDTYCSTFVANHPPCKVGLKGSIETYTNDFGHFVVIGDTTYTVKHVADTVYLDDPDYCCPVIKPYFPTRAVTELHFLDIISLGDSICGRFNYLYLCSVPLNPLCALVIGVNFKALLGLGVSHGFSGCVFTRGEEPVGLHSSRFDLALFLFYCVTVYSFYHPLGVVYAHLCRLVILLLPVYMLDQSLTVSYKPGKDLGYY